MTKEIRTSCPEPKPGDARIRLTLSITPDEHEAWVDAAEKCGMKVTRWAPIALNRLIMGIGPIANMTSLPASVETGKVKK